ncbi:MAG TPA: glycosyltransferase, partial [Patescibacteria group bacterium]|nr:glycosyltransferase [Patescibacteria group bacterium]
AILSYSNGRFDARTRRVAASAGEAGLDVVVYARWEPGLPLAENLGGLRIVRAPIDWRLAIPGLRAVGRRRVAALQASVRADAAAGQERVGVPAPAPVAPTSVAPTPRKGRRPLRAWLDDARREPVAAVWGAVWRVGSRVVRRVVRRALGVIRRPFQLLLLFPIRPVAWAAALEEVAEPADLWHGMWAGSLPALERLRGRHGGRTVYDSRDVYLHARVFDRLHPLARRPFLAWEQRWARSADAVVTVNDAYADILSELLGVPRPAVVRNCPDPYDPPNGPPDRLRARLDIPPATAIVLYQGGLMTERGIEQGMDAILQVPDAVLVVMGFGSNRALYAARAAEAPYRGRVLLADPVPPQELLEWTASADVMLMTIQPTTLNHRHTTPQKLWEAIAAGVPVVASDLPGMAEVVREVGCGLVCDPEDPTAIAASIRDLLGRSPEERAAARLRSLAAARETYNWAAQANVLLAVYERLLAPSATPPGRPAGRAVTR